MLLLLRAEYLPVHAKPDCALALSDVVPLKVSVLSLSPNLVELTVNLFAGGCRSWVLLEPAVGSPRNVSTERLLSDDSREFPVAEAEPLGGAQNTPAVLSFCSWAKIRSRRADL